MLKAFLKSLFVCSRKKVSLSSLVHTNIARIANAVQVITSARSTDIAAEVVIVSVVVSHLQWGATLVP